MRFFSVCLLISVFWLWIYPQSLCSSSTFWDTEVLRKSTVSTNNYFPNNFHYDFLKRTWLNNPDCFCFICDEYMFEKFCLNVSDFLRKAYIHTYCTPKLVCKICLRLWINKKKWSFFNYKIPMIWCEPSNRRLLLVCNNNHRVNLWPA